MQNLKKYFCLFLSIVLLASCAAPLSLKTPPKVSMEKYNNLFILDLQNDVIGEIDEDIMKEIMEESIERICELERFDKIAVEETIIISDHEIKQMLCKLNENDMNSETTASLKIILSGYDEGSPFLRFMFGVLAGGGEVTCDIQIIDNATDLVVLEAQTTANISGSFSSVDNVVTPISKAIANCVEDYFKVPNKVALNK